MRPLIVAARFPPEAVFWVGLLALSAAWAAHTGPGRSSSLLGAGAQGLVWTCLYLGLALAYRASSQDKGQATRGVLRRLAACLLLALMATQMVRLLLSHLAPSLWTHAFYLRVLLPSAFAGVWCAALLPRHTGQLLRAARADATIAPLPALAVLLTAAAVIVSCADMAFQLNGQMPTARAQGVAIGRVAWATNCLILFSGFALAFVVTSRVVVALLLVAPLYLTLAAATLIKIHYMHSAVQPLELIRLPEFLPLFVNFFGPLAAAAAVAAVALWGVALMAASRGAPNRLPARRSLTVGLLALAVLFAFPLAFFAAQDSPRIATLLRRVGAPDGLWKEPAIVSGFLLSFLSELPSLRISAPPHYSPAAIAEALRRYRGSASMTKSQSARPRVNLILYLVESFMEPNDLGVRYTSEPIPNVRAFRNSRVGGYAIVPEQFGGSANTEFEALTGMTMSFLPRGSLPYRQYLRHPVPSLPLVLRSWGYATTAVQPDSRSYYDRERVYNLLGFDRVAWLDEVPGIQRDPRVGWPTDHTVVDAVIAASRNRRPFFVFAFPSSTHSAYTSGVYRGSGLRLLDDPGVDSTGEVKEYVNALHVADREIGALIGYFSRQPDSTIIVILGDHLPPLSQNALRTFWSRLPVASQARTNLMLRRVPLTVWANFPLPREQPELSANALPSYILDKMGIALPPALSVTDAIRRQLPVVGRYMVGTDGHIWDHDSLPDSLRTLVRDYRLLQYDLLLGQRYALESGWAKGQLR
jgi:hypothetical protein